MSGAAEEKKKKAFKSTKYYVWCSRREKKVWSCS